MNRRWQSKFIPTEMPQTLILCGKKNLICGSRLCGPGIDSGTTADQAAKDKVLFSLFAV